MENEEIIALINKKASKDQFKTFCEFYLGGLSILGKILGVNICPWANFLYFFPKKRFINFHFF